MGVRWVEPLRRDVEGWVDHGKALALQMRGSESDPQNPYKKPGMAGHPCNPSNGKIEGSKARGHLELPAETGFWQSTRPISGPVSKRRRQPPEEWQQDISSDFDMHMHTCAHEFIHTCSHTYEHTPTPTQAHRGCGCIIKGSRSDLMSMEDQLMEVANVAKSEGLR